MLFTIALILAVIFAFGCKKILKKHAAVFYIAAAVISVVVAIADFKGAPGFVRDYVVGLFSRGAFATALWCVVMWIGALLNGTAAMKALMPIRGELSIFAAILTLGHNIGFGRTYFVRMFTNPASLSKTQLAAGTLSILMLVIMLPLTVLSFPKVRRKLDAKLWKRIQRAAYLFYAMIYAHVMILFVPSARNGRTAYKISVVIYSLVFIGYAAARIMKAIKKRGKSGAKGIVTVSAAVICFAAAMIFVLPTPSKVDTPVSVPAKSDAESGSDETSGGAESALTDDSTAPETSGLADGTYAGTAYGYDGDITVKVTIESGKITAIEASSEEEDQWYFEQAEKSVIAEIIASQSCEVDAVSGATYSSKGIMEAAAGAIAKASD